MKRLVPTLLLVAVLLSTCILMPISASAEYDFDSMTLEEVKNLEKAAEDYYNEMTKVGSDANKEIESLIAEKVGEHANGQVSTPFLGYSIKRERDVYTLSDTVKVKDTNGNSTKHEVEATFLNNGMMAFTRLVVDGEVLIDLDPAEVPGVDYIEVTCKTMIDELSQNALKAKDEYDGKYVAVTGLLSNVDSSGKYISISPDKYSFSTILCSIKSSEVLEIVKGLSKDQKITVYGKITDVGEIMGYYLDIIDIK